MGEAGFAKVVVTDTFTNEYPVGRDLEGRFLYLRDGERQWLLATFDFSYRFRRTCNRWRQAISEATGIPVACIWNHDSQSHSAPIANMLEGDACESLISTCLPAVKEAIASAEEAEVSYVVADLGDRWNMCREQYIPGLGCVTVWAGLEFDEAGRPYSQDPDIMLLAGWKPDLPAFKERIYFDRPADPQAALMVFRSRRSGKVLGHLSRFSGHPDVVGAAATHSRTPGVYEMSEYHYDPDWLGDLRQGCEAELGGIGVAVCGPTANLSAKKAWPYGYRDGVEESRRIGGGVAAECLRAFGARGSDWAPVRIVGAANSTVDLPMRPDVPRSHAELAAVQAGRVDGLKQAYQDAIAAGEPAYRIKRLIDDYYMWTCMDRIVDRWVGLSDEEMGRGVMRVELEALRLNDVVLAGLPGENLTQTNAWLKAQSLGNNLVVFDAINGYTCYMTTREQYDLGSYTYWCSALSRDASPVLWSASLDTIRRAWDSQ